MSDTANILPSALPPVDNILSAAEELRAAAAAKAREFKDALKTDEIKALTDRVAREAGARWREVSDNAAVFIKDHPGKAALAALGIGFAIGLLFAVIEAFHINSLPAMSAEIIPLPAPQEPAPSAALTRLPPPVPGPEEDSLSKLLKNPLVIAGGAMLAGMALTRLFSSSPMRKLARDLADEALKRARNSTEPAPSASLLEQGIEAVRPQITEAAKRFLADILRKS